MIFSHEFNDEKEIEVLRYEFEVRDSKSIQLNIIDGCFEHVPILVRDPAKKVRGLFTLKTRIKTHFIGEQIEHTTNGGIAGALPDGEWTLEIFKPSFRVTGKVQLEIRQDRQLHQLNAAQLYPVLDQDFHAIHEGHPHWLKAELHTHSYYSDGRVNFEDIQEEIDRKKLDAVAIMDHSIVTTQFLKGNNLVIPGTEITLDNEVHYNVYGLTQSVPYTDYFSENETKNQGLDKLFKDFKAQGYLLSINHPYADGLSMQHDFDVTRFNFIEVINAPYSTTDFIDNEKAIRFFDFLWSEGHYLFGIGGSDAHKKNYQERYPIGIPTNKIYCERPSVANVLMAMTNGNTYVEKEFPCDIQFLDETQNEVLPGTEFGGKLTLKGSSDATVLWQVIENGHCIAQIEGTSCSFEVEVKAGSYLRLEALKENKHVLFVNPVYYQMQQKMKTTSFAELVKKFETK